jgi:hypothetical protein
MDTVWDKIGKAEAALLSGTYSGSATAFLQKSVATAQTLIDGK